MQRFKQLLNNLESRQIAVIMVGIAILIIFVIYSVVTTIARSGKIEVTTKYAPYAATVTLNDSKISNNSKNWLVPGKYHIKVTYEHFQDLEYDIEIDEKNTYLVGILETADEQGVEYRKRHQQEFDEAQGIIGIALNKEGEARREKYPILNYVPINNSLYSISYSYDDNMEPIITAKSQPYYTDAIVDKMKLFKDVDLTQYQIIFTAKNIYTFYDDVDDENPKDCIKRAYANIISDKTVADGKYINDNYYATTISYHDFATDANMGTYRILLEKQDNKWHIVNDPQPILTIYNTPGVDASILKVANDLPNGL